MRAVDAGSEALFTAVAATAAALTGLLFVALSVTPHQSTPDRPVVVQEVRAAAAILAFTNALAVSLFGLVPGNNPGYAAVTTSVIGLLFTAAGTRSIVATPETTRRHITRQIGFVVLLAAIFVGELWGGVRLLRNAHAAGATTLVGNLLVALLLVGIARAWELVGDRDTGVVSSLRVLAGRGEARPAGGGAHGN